MALPLLSFLAAAALAADGQPPGVPAEEGPVPPDQPSLEVPVGVVGWRFVGVPLVAFGSDVGLTLGGALFFYKPVLERPSERHTFTLSGSWASRGPRNVDVGWSVLRLLGTSLQTNLNLHLGDDPNMPYWGEGARLGGLATPAGFGGPPEPYRYHDRRAFLSGTVRAGILGPLGWHLRARFLDVGVPEQSALLAGEAPPGARGGRVALGEVGLLYDSRDRDLGTRRGIFAAAAVFAAPALRGAFDFAFHGYDATVRVYVPLVLGATLAMRGLYDRKLPGLPWEKSEKSPSGAVPFFERMLYEGIAYNEGLGGGGTIRGVARYRISGDEKLLGNVQVRMPIVTVRPGGKSLEFGLSAGVDAGRASQPGFEPVEDGGVAVGLRVIWDAAILLRVEMGRARGGENTLFVAFGELF